MQCDVDATRNVNQTEQQIEQKEWLSVSHTVTERRP